MRWLHVPVWVHRMYAGLLGYGWKACPLSGHEFGGHQWRDRGGKLSSIPNGRPGGFTAICPSCTRAGRGWDDESWAEPGWTYRPGASQ